jgi:micrococcal nuclease|tara:strand:+ start:3908 stop:4213 length:306 start_codon:yes stop_codon:yes gene_type:complete
MYEYRAIVDRVIDGDTVDFIIDLGFNIKIKIRGRLEGVDTPERGHPDWSHATDVCKDLLQKTQANNGNEYLIITTTKTGKYGRWIVQIKGVTDELAKQWPY